MNDIRVLLGNALDEERHGYKCNFLVTLYGAYFDEGTVKIILELMDAGSLEDVISLYRTAKVQPRIEEGVLAKVALQMLCGLSYLHGKNQLHRDIKPANILLNSCGEVKLSDFGIARELLEEEDFSSTVIGTLSYKSPERIRSRKYGYKSDVWGIGLVLHELGTPCPSQPAGSSPSREVSSPTSSVSSKTRK
jgi:mitogen-activated protein kinase kinase 3